MRRREMIVGGFAIGGLAAGAGHSAIPDDMPKSEFAYEAVALLGPATPIGDTPRGKRNRIPITGGSLEGPRIRGKILPGGMDWQLIRPDGFLEVYADYMMQADDGA